MPRFSILVSLICVAAIFCATLLHVYVRFFGRSARDARQKAGSDSNERGNRVIWDISERDTRPVVKNGIVYLDRRGFTHGAVYGLVALIAVLSGKKLDGESRAVSLELYQPGLDELDHTDVPHHDHTGAHTDITCDPPECASHQHADGTPHSDTPHIDHTDNS